MDTDDREDGGSVRVNVPVILADTLSEVMTDILDRYHESIGLEEMDLCFCQAAMIAATTLTIQRLSESGESLALH